MPGTVDATAAGPPRTGRHARRTAYDGDMGELTIIGLIALIAIVAIPASILAGAVVYVVRLARRGSAATLVEAMKYRELA